MNSMFKGDGAYWGGTCSFDACRLRFKKTCTNKENAPLGKPKQGSFALAGVCQTSRYSFR